MNRSMNEYALPFAAWELRLYLDTNPNDERALAAYKQLCAAQGGCTYACHTHEGHNKSGAVTSTAGPRTACHGDGRLTVQIPCDKHGDDRWTWIDSPWPWEFEANMTGGKC